MKKNTFIILLSIAMITFLGSCTTVPTELDQDIKEEMFFKNAQEAMDMNRYNVALYYYEVYLVRYPENHHKTIGAEYERALIYYKMKEYEYSKTLFQQVLDKYDNSPFAIMYPERYKILSNKLLDIIEEEINPSPKEENTEEA